MIYTIYIYIYIYIYIVFIRPKYRITWEAKNMHNDLCATLLVTDPYRIVLMIAPTPSSIALAVETCNRRLDRQLEEEARIRTSQMIKEGAKSNQ